MRYFILLFIFIYFVIYLFGTRINHEQVVERQCRDYESQGVIPVNSCDCTEKLFDSWEKSYDWMDACKILENK